MTRIAAALVLILVGAASAAAQETRIAAVVNDDMISLGDLDARVRLVLLSSQLPDNDQVRQRATPQVLRTLIDEKLEVQEAKKLNVTVSDDEVNKTFERLEQQNNLPKGGLDKMLSQNNIPRSTLTDQISASLMWNKLVEQKLGPTVSISDEEVKDTLARIKQEVGKPQYRVAEIYLAIDNPSQEADVKALADRLIDQMHPVADPTHPGGMRPGASFPAVAQQFSQSPTAAVGGDLGWLTTAELPRDIATVVQGMQPGQLSARSAPPAAITSSACSSGALSARRDRTTCWSPSRGSSSRSIPRPPPRPKSRRPFSRPSRWARPRRAATT